MTELDFDQLVAEAEAEAEALADFAFGLHEQIEELPASARPIFVIGPLRSGGSLLTAALGQHPNIRLLGENAWLQPFTRGLRGAFEQHAGRRDVSHLEAMGIDLELFMLYFGEAVNRLLLHPPTSVSPIPVDGIEEPPQPYPGKSYQPQRWVDNSLESTWNAIDLWRLFPLARFIHVVRDADETVNVLIDPETRHSFRSRALILPEDEAWEHYLEGLAAALKTEEALGSETVLRVRRDDLLNDPTAEMLRVFQFIDEPFDSRVMRVFR